MRKVSFYLVLVSPDSNVHQTGLEKIEANGGMDKELAWICGCRKNRQGCILESIRQ